MLKVIIVLAAVIFLEVFSQRHQNYDKYMEKSKIENVKFKPKGFGISAWGLVFLIIAVILLGIFIYYMVIFYPLLCKEERRYDRIELAAI